MLIVGSKVIQNSNSVLFTSKPYKQMRDSIKNILYSFIPPLTQKSIYTYIDIYIKLIVNH